MLAGRFVSSCGGIIVAVALVAGCGSSTSSTPATTQPPVAPATSSAASSPVVSPSPSTAAPSPVPSLSATLPSPIPSPSLPAVPAPSPNAAAGPLTTITIGITSKSAGALSLYLAEDLGIFAEHGLDAQFIITQPGALPAALSQNQLDFIANIPPALQGAEQGLPLRIIVVVKDHPEYVLVGDTGVTTVAQLQDKPIAGGLPTQLPAQMLSQLLSVDGLQAGQYQIVTAENDPARAALLLNHQVSAAIVGLAEALPLLDQGFPLIDDTMSKIYSPGDGLAVSVSGLQQNRDVDQRAVLAVIEGTQIAASDEARAESVLENDFGLSPSDAQQVFKLEAPTYSPSGCPSPQAVQTQIQLDTQSLGLSPTPTPSQLYDFSLLPAPCASGQP